MVGEAFPAFALMRTGQPGLYREHRVEQQHALPCPWQQAAVVGRRDAQIALNLGKDIAQRGRYRHSRWYRKAQSVRLPRPVVRVLTEDNHLHRVKRDRKSVGTGKSGLVRVDLGGRRTYKKKK